jgi:hypothetical protein
MVDSSWDNSGPPPQKKGLGTGMKVLMGCGIAVLLAVVTCAVGGAVLGNYIKKDPKAFELRVEGFAKGLVQKDWERFRALADQLQTDDGARALYRANPGLGHAHATEELFLQAVRAWRPRLTPLPTEAPVGKHRRHRRDRDQQEEASPEAPAVETPRQPSVDIQMIFGSTRIRCTYPNGTRLAVTFDGERVKTIEVE